MIELVGDSFLLVLLDGLLLFLKLFLVWGICNGVEVVGVMFKWGEGCLVRSGREGDEGGIMGSVDWSDWLTL